MKKEVLFIVALIFISALKSEACTRAVYVGEDNTVVTGRTMDWNENMHSNIWLFPRGMKRDGEVGGNSLKWKSKYGSIVTSAYEFSSTDGINEKGLVANLLWLPESQYEDRDKNKPGLTIAAWTQYFLDNFATVDEAVAEVQRGNFQLVSDMMPDGSRMATLHLAISDATGDNAIFEFIDNKMNIYHGKEYVVMTNSPAYPLQLSLNDYWKSVGGLAFLPGTNKSPDRFARASFYIGVLPKTADQQIAVASVFSVMRNVSVPYGISVPGSPEISTTQWRTVSDSKNLVYFFESAITPNTFWVNLKDANFSEGAPVKKLSISEGQIYSGNTIKDFKESSPFKFLSVGD